MRQNGLILTIDLGLGAHAGVAVEAHYKPAPGIQRLCRHLQHERCSHQPRGRGPRPDGNARKGPGPLIMSS